MLPTLPHLPLKLLLPQPLPPLLLLKLNKTARAKTGDNFSGLPSLSQTRLVNTRRFLLTSKTARAKTGDNFSGLPSLSQPCLVNKSKPNTAETSILVSIVEAPVYAM